jgi:hypothetical protein
MTLNAAVFILTQNTDARKVYLKTTLYFFFKHFNAECRYPVFIFHEGDFTPLDQREILLSIRASCRSLVTFRAVDQGDFEYPSFIDEQKVKDVVAAKVTPYWRSEQYRKMCRWWLLHMPRYAKPFDYVMRLDDDSIIEEPIPDLFDWMHKKDLVYASNLLHIDCALCCYGMKEFFLSQFPDKTDSINKLFVEQEIPTRTFELAQFRALLSITQQKALPDIGENFKLSAPLMYYNNFFITKTEFWHRPEVQQLIRDIDETGNIFYIRWGDAPLQTLVAMLLGGADSVSRCVFRYSKRMQREAFRGDDGEFQCYLPTTYTETTCITDKKN